MTPEYLRELADMVDPLCNWKRSPFEQMDLPDEQRRKLDAGVALRRHAAHIERLDRLIGTGKSLVVTPITHNSCRIRELKV